MKISLQNSLLISLCLFAVASFISIAAANMFLGLSVLIFLIITYKNKCVHIATDKLPYFKAVGAFAGALIVSALFSGDIAYGLKTWADFFLWRFMPFVILLTVLDSETLSKKVLAAVTCGFAIDCMCACYQELFVYGFDLNFKRAAGFVGHPMTLAGWACILLPLLLIYIFRKNIAPRFRWLAVVFFVIGGSALLFNATRGAWLALAIVLPLVSLPFVFENKKLLLICTSIVLVLGIVLFNNASFMKRVHSIADTKNVSNHSRFIIWDTSVAMFKEQPVLGVGLGNYKDIYQKNMRPRLEEARGLLKNVATFKKLSKKEQIVILYNPEKFWELKIYKKLKNKEWQAFYKEYSKFKFNYDLSTLTHAHNNLLQMLAENGLVGFLGYIFTFGYILWCNLKNFLLNKNPYALMIVGSTSALFLQGLTEYNFGNGAVMKLYWLVLGCLVILASHYNKEESSKDAE